MNFRNFGFLPYQVNWLNDTSQIKLYEKSRRIGITYAQAFEDVIDAGVYGTEDVWFSSNSDTNAREYILYCKRFARVLNAVIIIEGGAELIDSKAANTYVLTFKNGKRITALSSNPEQLHGKGGKIILDEFARRDNEFEVWEAGSPAATVWGHPIRIISTHKGKSSMFYSFIERIKKKELTWSHHRTTFIEAVNQGLGDKAKRKTLTTQEKQTYIDTIRQESGSALIWKQQYMCEAVDDNDVFLPYAILEPIAKAELLPLKRLSECKTLYAGLDVGRFRNLSVLWVVEKISPALFVTRYIKTIQGKDFPKQEQIISGIIKTCPNLRRLCIDRTGMGIGLTDYLQYAHGESRIEGVNFTRKVKEEMAFRLRKHIEDIALLIPNDEVIKDDLNSVQRSTTVTGNIRLVADTNTDTGSHADYFWAVALALEAGSNGRYVQPEVITSAYKQYRSNKVAQLFKGWKKLS